MYNVYILARCYFYRARLESRRSIHLSRIPRQNIAINHDKAPRTVKRKELDFFFYTHSVHATKQCVRRIILAAAQTGKEICNVSNRHK